MAYPCTLSNADTIANPAFLARKTTRPYLHWLGEALKKERCELHAYALMTNPVHLLVTPVREQSIPRLIIALGRRYVHYINTIYRRTGTRWDSRYMSSLIQAETYLLSCQRYIPPDLRKKPRWPVNSNVRHFRTEQ